jgi:serine/threonine-protein phosphatase 2B regulatory subunit
MGIFSSSFSRESCLEAEDIEILKEITRFNNEEINRLYKRFQRLDKTQSGSISADQFMEIPELAMNPLSKRILSVLRANQQSVNFKTFITFLSVFSHQASKEEKLKFAFKIYDEKDDGIIDREELFNVLKMMVGNNLHRNEIFALSQKVMDDIGVDGIISFENFAKILNDCVTRKMTFAF